jgi:hypothetical protein
MAEIKIDSKIFQERVSHFATAWKNDLRSKDGQFGGATSILVMMGKVEEVPEFHKNNAMHVCTSAPASRSRNVSLIQLLVLATWLRVPNDADALHGRYALHPHNRKEG